jgi:hypothetical protein
VVEVAHLPRACRDIATVVAVKHLTGRRGTAGLTRGECRPELPRRRGRGTVAAAAGPDPDGVHAFILPDTGEVLNADATNATTFLGAVCFLIGGALLMPRREPTARLRPA